MNLNITIGGSPAVEAWLTAMASTTNATLARIESKLDAVNLLEKTNMINVQALTDAVAAETAVDASILTLVQKMADNEVSLSKQLADAIASNDPVALAAVQKAIDDSAAQMTANAGLITAAVLANTPAAPAPAV